ncbi:MAG: class I SAM-dependent methyltransferase [Chitinophagaceae bacterium]
MYPQALQHLSIHNNNYSFLVPQAEVVENTYAKNKHTGADFPYWTKIWPASIALSEFILINNNIFKDASVIEVAGGIGLPSLIASQFAKNVVYTDYLPEAVHWFNYNIQLWKVNNINSRVINWHHLPTNLTADFLLLSDVNYNTTDFEALLQLFNVCKAKRISIFLAVPQRVSSSLFMKEIAHFIQNQYSFKINNTHCLVLSI